ncbi:MAG TPA: hypothetical protein VL523_19475, partial [Terriglobia bacterium]|nr:hypothetical protein [Terriglobia bacterium]
SIAPKAPWDTENAPHRASARLGRAGGPPAGTAGGLVVKCAPSPTSGALGLAKLDVDERRVRGQDLGQKPVVKGHIVAAGYQMFAERRRSESAGLQGIQRAPRFTV